MSTTASNNEISSLSSNKKKAESNGNPSSKRLRQDPSTIMTLAGAEGFPSTDDVLFHISKLPKSDAHAIIATMMTAGLDNAKKEVGSALAFHALLDREDTWTGSILPFVGLGHYIFVAGTCKPLKKLYEKYVSSLEEKHLPKLKHSGKTLTPHHTFYLAACTSESHVEIWYDSLPKEAKDIRSPKDVIIVLKKKLLDSKQCPWTATSCKAAVRNGNFKLLKWLHDNGCPWDEAVCAEAAWLGHLDVLQYAHENGCPWDDDVCAFAACEGHLDVMKYAHENGCPWDAAVCSNAVWWGHVDVLKYAHENGLPWHEVLCAKAAERGHLEVLKYAHENGCPWNEDTCKEAAGGGHLEALKYAHENGCPWNSWTCLYAVRSRNLDVLKYAHENGCPWTHVVYNEAVFAKNLGILKYAYENGCPGYDMQRLLRAATSLLVPTDIIEYLRARPWPLPR